MDIRIIIEKTKDLKIIFWNLFIWIKFVSFVSLLRDRKYSHFFENLLSQMFDIIIFLIFER